MSHAISDIGHAISNPGAILGSALGLGVGGAGGLTGANLAGNAATGQSLGTNLGGAIGGDLAGLGIGAGAAGVMGGGDPFAGFTVDPATGDVVPVSSGAAGVGAGGTVSSGLGGAGGLAGPGASVLSGLLGGGGGGAAGGNPFMNFLTGQGGGPSLPSLAPGLAALAYASQQKPIDTGQLQNTFNASAANAPAFIQAAQNPLQQAQQQGYGDILQSQASRGIRGSSFGDQDIGNFLNTTNQGIATAGTNAAEAALGLQGSLAGQIANLNALSQQMKNNLYGRAFSSIGQGLSPTPGMGGGGFPVQGGGVGGAPGMGGAGGFLNNLNLGGIGSAFGNGLSSIGSGLGNMFGSPGSSFWGSAPIQGMPTDFLGDMAGF